MSGVQQTYPFPTNLETEPPPGQGSKVARYVLNWAAIFTGNASQGYVTTINLLQQFLSGQFTTIQAIYIDNSTNYYPVTIVAEDSGQSVTCGPFSEGMFPLVAANAAQFLVSLNVIPQPSGFVQAVGSTKLFFFNTPQKPFLSQQLGLGTNFQTANGILGTWGSTAQILPALGPNNYYAMSAFTLTAMTAFGGAGFAAAQSIGFRVQEAGFTSNLFQDSALCQTGVVLYYSNQILYPQPVIQPHPNTALNLATINSSGSSTAGYPPTLGYYATWQATYGVVTIS
jgi:hypothetical protein